jgi:hypothetical protein
MARGWRPAMAPAIALTSRALCTAVHEPIDGTGTLGELRRPAGRVAPSRGVVPFLVGQKGTQASAEPVNPRELWTSLHRRAGGMDVRDVGEAPR